MYLKKFILSCGLNLSLFFSLVAHAEDKLIFAIDIIRHGDRTPTDDIPNSPYTWPQGLGQLTAQGMQQEYQLGLAMHKRYIEQNHLLPKHYFATTMYVRSSDFNRTLMSAQSLLLGLYPLGSGPNLPGSEQSALPGNYQPIAIMSVRAATEDLLLPTSNEKAFQAAETKYVYSQKAWLQKQASLKNKLAKWQQLTGCHMTKLQSVIVLGDNLFIRKLHHIPLPAGINDETADEIIAAGQWAMVNRFKPREVGEEASRQLLARISKELTNASLQKSDLKYILFSGHDTTLLAVMSALQNPLTEQPRYASNLNFSLYQNEKNYFVKVTFNDKPVQIPGCGSVCTLTQFNKVMRAEKTNSLE